MVRHDCSCCCCIGSMQSKAIVGEYFKAAVWQKILNGIFLSYSQHGILVKGRKARARNKVSTQAAYLIAGYFNSGDQQALQYQEGPECENVSLARGTPISDTCNNCLIHTIQYTFLIHYIQKHLNISSRSLVLPFLQPDFKVPYIQLTAPLLCIQQYQCSNDFVHLRQ